MIISSFIGGKKYVNLIALSVTLITFFLVWIIFFSQPKKSVITDPLEVFSPISLFNIVFAFINSPFGFITICILIMFYVYDPLIYIVLKPVLNTCIFCKNIRNSKRSALVNGECSKCGTHICKKCFFFVNTNPSNKKSNVGCPSCGCNSFNHNKKLGYPLLHVPHNLSLKLNGLKSKFNKE